MVQKPAKYGILFQSLNSVQWPFTHSIIVGAGKPEDTKNARYYINTIPGKVKKLVSKTKNVRSRLLEEILVWVFKTVGEKIIVKKYFI